MRILVTNDDGINAVGLRKLVEMAVQLGEVYIVAPAQQCSAMSMCISLRKPMEFREVEYPVPNVKAYSLNGTPADCVKVALSYLLSEKPDIIFSGINLGFNTAYDILYSGTVGAAFEGLLHGIPAIAFSNDASDNFDVVEKHILDITKELINNPPKRNEIYNVNFPSCSIYEIKGIKKDITISQNQIYKDHYYKSIDKEGSIFLEEAGDKNDLKNFLDGTDVYYVLNNYIAICTVKCPVLPE